MSQKESPENQQNLQQSQEFYDQSLNLVILQQQVKIEHLQDQLLQFMKEKEQLQTDLQGEKFKNRKLETEILHFKKMENLEKSGIYTYIEKLEDKKKQDIRVQPVIDAVFKEEYREDLDRINQLSKFYDETQIEWLKERVKLGRRLYLQLQDKIKNDEDIKVVAYVIRSLKQLSILEIALYSNGGVKSTGIFSLTSAISELKNIVQLNLDLTSLKLGVTDQGPRYIAGMINKLDGNLTKLELNMEDNELNDLQAQNISDKIVNIKNIRRLYLNFARNQLTRDCQKKIEKDLSFIYDRFVFLAQGVN